MNPTIESQSKLTGEAMLSGSTSGPGVTVAPLWYIGNMRRTSAAGDSHLHAHKVCSVRRNAGFMYGPPSGRLEELRIESQTRQCRRLGRFDDIAERRDLVSTYNQTVREKLADPIGSLQSVDPGVISDFDEWFRPPYQDILWANAAHAAAYRQRNGARGVAVRRTFIINPSQLSKIAIRNFCQVLYQHVELRLEVGIVYDSGGNVPDGISGHDLANLAGTPVAWPVEGEFPVPFSEVFPLKGTPHWHDVQERVAWAMDLRNLAAIIRCPGDVDELIHDLCRQSCVTMSHWVLDIAPQTPVKEDVGWELLKEQRDQVHACISSECRSGWTTLNAELLVRDLNSGRGLALVDPRGRAGDQLLDWAPRVRSAAAVLFDGDVHSDVKIFAFCLPREGIRDDLERSATYPLWMPSKPDLPASNRKLAGEKAEPTKDPSASVARISKRGSADDSAPQQVTHEATSEFDDLKRLGEQLTMTEDPKQQRDILLKLRALGTLASDAINNVFRIIANTENAVVHRDATQTLIAIAPDHPAVRAVSRVVLGTPQPKIMDSPVPLAQVIKNALQAMQAILVPSPADQDAKAVGANSLESLGVILRNVGQTNGPLSQATGQVILHLLARHLECEAALNGIDCDIHGEKAIRKVRAILSLLEGGSLPTYEDNRWLVRALNRMLQAFGLRLVDPDNPESSVSLSISRGKRRPTGLFKLHTSRGGRLRTIYGRSALPPKLLVAARMNRTADGDAR